MTLYKVTLRHQFPDAGCRDGFVYHVEARSKSEAIREARRQARGDGHVGYGNANGLAWFKATEEVVS
jgi:hypothetical protein